MYLKYERNKLPPAIGHGNSLGFYETRGLYGNFMPVETVGSTSMSLIYKDFQNLFTGR
jgi:hypothetical protein